MISSVKRQPVSYVAHNRSGEARKGWGKLNPRPSKEKK